MSAWDWGELTMREKLIELLYKLPTPEPVVGIRTGKKLMTAGFIADHLIANGVTIRKWIPVSERLPEDDGKYLVFKQHHYGAWQNVVGFAKDGDSVSKYDLANEKDVWYNYDSEYGYYSLDSVTHWMPLPEPPKEVE